MKMRKVGLSEASGDGNRAVQTRLWEAGCPDRGLKKRRWTVRTGLAADSTCLRCGTWSHWSGRSPGRRSRCRGCKAGHCCPGMPSPIAVSTRLCRRAATRPWRCRQRGEEGAAGRRTGRYSGASWKGRRQDTGGSRCCSYRGGAAEARCRGRGPCAGRPCSGL